MSQYKLCPSLHANVLALQLYVEISIMYDKIKSTFIRNCDSIWKFTVTIRREQLLSRSACKYTAIFAKNRLSLTVLLVKNKRVRDG